MLDTCGMCHARRAELTGDFVPGDKFFDHFALSIPDESEMFYPDGQIHDEDYEYTSFLGSKMHTAGVRCMDCHDPHTNKNVVEGNALCMRCHGSPVPVVPTVAQAPPIVDPDHSFHKAGTPGSRCVDCHMPETTYMQRHARRDHGFTIPDPLLTKEHNIPNACNRCHADKTADWALEACNKWYGDKMNRPTRTRAEWVAQAKAGAPGASQNLRRLIAEEKNPLWRAVAVNLLRGTMNEPWVFDTVVNATQDSSDLVRGMAARTLGTLIPPSRGMEANTVTTPVDGPGGAQLHTLLDDPSRSVRLDAAWALRRTLDPGTHAGSEMLYALDLNRDQPTGLTQWATWLEDRGDAPGALAAFQKAVEWDPGSAALHSNYAIALSLANRPDEAVKQLAEAVRVAPKDAQMRYTYALSLNEVNRAAEAREQLEEAVKLEPGFARAWYNLGLARNAANEIGPALDALSKAESLDPQNAEAAYAAATILARLQRVPEAAAAARRALKIDPNYTDAAELLRSLHAQGG
jgi:predicted CXXCH cytochrome family protein